MWSRVLAAAAEAAVVVAAAALEAAQAVQLAAEAEIAAQSAAREPLVICDLLNGRVRGAWQGLGDWRAARVVHA